MRALGSIGAVLAALLWLAPAAAGAESAVIELDATGAGTIVIDALDGRTGDAHLGAHCGGVPGATEPLANLANPTGTRQRLCTLTWAPNRCPAGEGPDCLLRATARAQAPGRPQLTAGEAAADPPHWRFTGWLEAPDGCAIGGEASCTFTYGSCVAGVCSYRDPVTLLAAFADTRAPTAIFGCRNAAGAADSSSCTPRPPALITDPAGTATFRARSDEYAGGEHSRIECQLDEAAWTPCPPAPGPVTPGTFALTGVTDGAHVLRIRAVDPSGNVQTATAQTASWTQRYPPVTTITGGPAEEASVTTRRPEFTFAADRMATFECRFDAGAWVACADRHSPAVSLTHGPHTFAVRATRTTEEGRIEELAPPVRHFHVDLVPPEALITDGPDEGLVTTSRSAHFRFAADPPEPVSFGCALDAGAPEPCDAGTVSYASLPAGRHTFTLTVTDAAGNRQSPPPTRTWTVIADADQDQFFAPHNDCNDADAAIHPGARDVPGNGIDEDCDGADPPNLDRDGDGFATAPQGRDCNDRDAKIRPGAREILGNGVDEDCDGIDPPDLDRDRDGVLVAPAGGDCDDGDARIRPGARDVPGNRVDEDCDGGDAVRPLIGVGFRAQYRLFPTHTQLLAFEVLDVPAGSKITIRCRGGCPKTKRRRIRVERRRARLDVSRHIGRRLPRGATLTVTVARQGTVTQGRRYVIRGRQGPRRLDFCLRKGRRVRC